MFNKIKDLFVNPSNDKALEAPCEPPTEMIISPSGSWMYASPVILVDPAQIEQERTSKPAITAPAKFTKSQ